MINGIKRVGIFGGTFSPPHQGHICAARAFIEQMKLDTLMIIPASIPPHKQIDESDDPNHRLQMCRLAFEGTEKVVISDMEIARGGRSFTVDTLRELTAPEQKLFLLCGTDMMLTFDTWREFETIFKLCCPVYIRRESDKEIEKQIIEKNTEYHTRYGTAFRRILSDPIEISSTEIRKIILAGGDMTEYLPDKVEKYIRENNLYS